MTQDLSLLVCSHNTPEVLHVMLKSFVGTNKPIRLVICENSTNEETAELLAREGIGFFRHAGWKHEEGMNFLFKNCPTKYALVADSDVVFFENIERYFEDFKASGAVLSGEVCGSRGGKKLKDRVHPWFCFVDVEFMNANNILFSDDERITTLDENGFGYDVATSMYEDAVKAGGKILSRDLSGTAYYHFEGMSWRTRHEEMMGLYREVLARFNGWKETFANVSIKNFFLSGSE